MQGIVCLAQNNLSIKLASILTAYSDQREYLGDGYYRIQAFGAHCYELEFSLSGPCGTFESHPAIKFQYLPDMAEPLVLYYRDMVVSPIQLFKPETEAEQTLAQTSLVELIERFYQAKHNRQ